MRFMGFRDRGGNSRASEGVDFARRRCGGAENNAEHETGARCDPMRDSVREDARVAKNRRATGGGERFTGGKGASRSRDGRDCTAGGAGHVCEGAQEGIAERNISACARENAVAQLDISGELYGMKEGCKTLWCGKEICITANVLRGGELLTESVPSVAERAVTVLDGECEITVRRGRCEHRLHATRGNTVALPQGACCDILNLRRSSRAALYTVWARHRTTGASLANER